MVKTVTYFREFGYLNSSVFNVLEFLEREIHAFAAKLSDRMMFLLVSGCRVGALLDGWAPAWHFHTNLYKFG